MEDIYIRLILGHLFGDYMFQTKKMALAKGEKGLNGALICAFHSAVYTITVMTFLWKFNILIFALVFLSHYPIDRWSLASKWLDMIKGRNFVTAYTSKEKYREIDLSFSCIVYTVVDNTMHFFLLWLIARFLF
ncbi:MAG: DUF3307 domain-containing protein [bacterium]|nr:DUF3307 domain-containing protein [bacterium]